LVHRLAGKSIDCTTGANSCCAVDVDVDVGDNSSGFISFRYIIRRRGIDRRLVCGNEIHSRRRNRS